MSGFEDVFKDLLNRITTLEKRVSTLESFEYIKFYPILGSSALVIDTAINAATTYTSGNLRGTAGIGTRAKGFLGTLWIDALATDCILRITSGDDTPNAFTQLYRWEGAVGEDRQLMSQPVLAFLGLAGTVKIECITTNCHVYVTAFGYWE